MYMFEEIYIYIYIYSAYIMYINIYIYTASIQKRESNIWRKMIIKCFCYSCFPNAFFLVPSASLLSSSTKNLSRDDQGFNDGLRIFRERQREQLLSNQHCLVMIVVKSTMVKMDAAFSPIFLRSLSLFFEAPWNRWRLFNVPPIHPKICIYIYMYVIYIYVYLYIYDDDEHFVVPSDVIRDDLWFIAYRIAISLYDIQTKSS